MKNGETVSYLWEIDLLSITNTNAMIALPESLKFNFQTKYASADKTESSHDLNYEFILSNYEVKTKYIDFKRFLCFNIQVI